MSTDPRSKRPRREDYERALQSVSSFVDIEVEDLMTLAERAEHFAEQRTSESIAVTRIMSQPVRTVHADTRMAEAAHLMVSTRISGLPVLDDDGCLIGIITEADFLRALGVPAHHPSQTLWQTLESVFSHLGQSAGIERPDDPVADHMVRNVVCASADQDVHDVLDLMKRHRVKRVVVCDEQRSVVGMITRSDLLRLFFDRFREEPSTSQD